MDQPDPQPKPALLETLRILFSGSRGFWLVNLANFGDGVAYFGILALMTLFMEKNVGFSSHWSTVSISIFSGGVTIFMALGGGYVSDRLGVRRALTLCFALLLAGRILYAICPGMGGPTVVGAFAWAGLLIMAMGEGVIQPALYSGIKEYTDSRTETMGYAFLYSIMNLGIVAGELLSPKIREYWAEHVEGKDLLVEPTAGITGTFWFFIAVTAVLLLANISLFTRKVEERDRLVVKPREKLQGTLWERMKNLPIMDARFLFFIFILLPVRTLFAHQWLTMPQYVTRAFPAEVGARWEWLNGINPLIIVVFVPVIAALTQKRRVVDMMIVGTAVSALSTFLLAREPSTTLLITYFVFWSLGESAWSSRFLEYVADIAPVNKVGIYMGIAGLPWFLAKTTTGFYAGAMLDRFIPEAGPHAPATLWLIYGLIALISPLGLISARRWLLAEERSSK